MVPSWPLWNIWSLTWLFNCLFVFQLCFSSLIVWNLYQYQVLYKTSRIRGPNHSWICNRGIEVQHTYRHSSAILSLCFLYMTIIKGTHNHDSPFHCRKKWTHTNDWGGGGVEKQSQSSATAARCYWEKALYCLEILLMLSGDWSPDVVVAWATFSGLYLLLLTRIVGHVQKRKWMAIRLELPLWLMPL